MKRLLTGLAAEINLKNQKSYKTPVLSKNNALRPVNKNDSGQIKKAVSLNEQGKHTTLQFLSPNHIRVHKGKSEHYRPKKKDKTPNAIVRFIEKTPAFSKFKKEIDVRLNTKDHASSMGMLHKATVIYWLLWSNRKDLYYRTSARGLSRLLGFSEAAIRNYLKLLREINMLARVQRPKRVGGWWPEERQKSSLYWANFSIEDSIIYKRRFFYSEKRNKINTKEVERCFKVIKKKVFSCLKIIDKKKLLTKIYSFKTELNLNSRIESLKHILHPKIRKYFIHDKKRINIPSLLRGEITSIDEKFSRVDIEQMAFEFLTCKLTKREIYELFAFKLSADIYRVIGKLIENKYKYGVSYTLKDAPGKTEIKVLYEY